MRRCSTSFVIREIKLKLHTQLEGLEFKVWPSQVLRSVVALGRIDRKVPEETGNCGYVLWTQQSLTVLQLIEIWVVARLRLWQMQRCATQRCPQERVCCPAAGSVVRRNLQLSFFGVHLSFLTLSPSSLRPVTQQSKNLEARPFAAEAGQFPFRNGNARCLLPRSPPSWPNLHWTCITVWLRLNTLLLPSFHRCRSLISLINILYPKLHLSWFPGNLAYNKGYCKQSFYRHSCSGFLSCKHSFL